MVTFSFVLRGRRREDYPLGNALLFLLEGVSGVLVGLDDQGQGTLLAAAVVVAIVPSSIPGPGVARTRREPQPLLNRQYF